MGLEIRYTGPAAAGTTFAYAVQRCGDDAFFDFGLEMFRPRMDILMQALTRPMVLRGVTAVTTFDHMEFGESYIVHVYCTWRRRIYRAVEMPITPNREDCGSANREKQYMGTSYRAGKKLLDGKVIDAKYRLTVYGDDGFTVHTATLWEDGTSSCNCPRWGKSVDRLGRRSCPHSERALTLISNIDETGDQPEPPLANTKEATPFQRRRRSIDT